jgi:hypothetical protein
MLVMILARSGIFVSCWVAMERNQIFSILPQALKWFFNYLEDALRLMFPTKTVRSLRSLI